ncbi:MAG TPA: alpha/beta hydrolase [Gemmatimonadaceae bacterium]|nr:alpha/beta hydrolase [Gemmatimonadaceae bacterium]
MLQVPAGPGSLHVERYGLGGDPVVLLPAFGTSAFLWRAVGPALAEHGYMAYAIDPMGYGESDRPFEGDYAVAAQAEYVRAALGSLRVDRATVVGVEIGAGIALRLAINSPELVSTLVLINPVAFDAWPSDDVRYLQNATVRHAVRLARGILGAAALLEPLLVGSVADPGHMPQRLIARYLAPYTGTDGAVHLLDLARALHTEDLEDPELTRIRQRTVIVRGEEDRSLSATIAARLHAGIPGSAMRTIPGAARLLPEDAPDQLTDLLLRVLDGVRIEEDDAEWNES